MSAAVKCLLLFLAMAAVSAGSPERPAAVALEYLEKVRSGTVNLEPGGDTALSPLTGQDKRREIADRLERLAQDLGGGQLEAGEVIEEADHAAVMVYRSGGYDPARVRVFPVALVRRPGGWVPAPVPASFENTGLGYTAAVRQRLAELERWMIRQQVAGLEALRQRLAGRLRDDMASRIDMDELLVLTPAGVAGQFVAACANRDTPAMLGLLGGLQGTLPDDWSQRMAAVEAAVADGANSKRPWRLLMAPEVVRTLVHEEISGDEALVSIACLDPFSGPRSNSVPRVELLHIELIKSGDGFWQLNPPSRFFTAGEEPVDLSDPEDSLDGDLLDLVPEGLRKELPAAPARTLDQAVAALADALRAADLHPALRLLDLGGEPRLARLGCVRAARAWRLVHDPAVARRPVMLGSHEVGSAAVAVFQFFSSREPDRTYFERFFFRHGEDGWLLAAGLAPDATDEDTGTLLAWVSGQERDWQNTWRDEMLAASPRVEFLNQPAPAADEARAVVAAWLQAIAERDLVGAISLTARLGDERGASGLLRNLSYEFNGARNSGREATVAEVFEGDGWCAVGAHAGDEQEPLYPLYPVVSTPDGARLLIEIDLFATGDGGRKRNFLNTVSLGRLKNFATAERIAELRGMLETYQKSAAAAAVEAAGDPAEEEADASAAE
jgi:hypothetical protein